MLFGMDARAVLSAIVAVLVAVFGYIGNSRGKKVTDAVSLMAEMRAFNQQVLDAEAKCRADMVLLRADTDRRIDELEAEVEALRRQVEG
jgi:hypothetical protein